MSDISIPGVNSNYNSDKIVEDLMRLERIPLTRLENQLENYEFQRRSWRELNLSFVRFRDLSRNLYNFQNPFNSRIAESSDSYYLTARASREALESSTEIEVIQVAKADRLLSGSLEDNYSVPAGTYGFKVGDEEIEVAFRGGSLRSFSEAVNRRGGNILRSTVVRDTASTQVLSIEAVNTGQANRLFFLGDSIPLALSLGIIKENVSNSVLIDPGPRDFRTWTKPLAGQELSQAPEGVVFAPETEAKLPVSLSASRTGGMVLEFTLSVRNIREEDFTPPPVPPGPAIPATGEISFENIRVYSEASAVDLPDRTPPPPPPRRDDGGLVFLQDGERIVPLPPSDLTDGSRTIRVLLSEYVDSLSSLNIRNNNTHREIGVSAIRIYDPNARGDYAPANPLSTAQDSLIRVEGIPISRSGNEISDAIPGVTLTLRRPSPDPIAVDVRPDREAVKDALINFVGTYNRLMAELNILTSSDPTVVEQIEYYTPEERETAMGKLGLYQGDSTLNQIKNSFQRMMMEAYPTNREQSLALLAQVGISTNSTGAVGYNAARLRGYLEINEETLDARIETDLSAIKELFGSDQDGDLVVDRGLAYELDTFLRAYVETGGILPNRVTTLDTRIGRTNTEIANFQTRLETKEAELRRQYGAMEGTIQSLQDSTRALNNLNINGSNNSR
ncbi:MAG: flagellar filament capping protein FliD [Spirochaetales bacterium]|jgi:flagellar hook-associated protein 2|nr:flagellar filament capping protein FliD [Spirochaetales bacterium]